MLGHTLSFKKGVGGLGFAPELVHLTN
jgi:hypothetical protein